MSSALITTNFDLFFKTLAKIGYSGDFIIQGAREDESIISPHETCSKYRIFVKNYLGCFEVFEEPIIQKACMDV